ncbi:hypothetical protein [Kribbella sp. NPDC051620]
MTPSASPSGENEKWLVDNPLVAPIQPDTRPPAVAAIEAGVW